MTKQEWKSALEPFAIVLAGMVEYIKAMDDEELLSLRKACDSPTKINCWCWTYSAAKVIRNEVDDEISSRKL
jgi:hypothetical protein